MTAGLIYTPFCICSLPDYSKTNQRNTFMQYFGGCVKLNLFFCWKSWVVKWRITDLEVNCNSDAKTPDAQAVWVLTSTSEHAVELHLKMARCSVWRRFHQFRMNLEASLIGAGSGFSKPQSKFETNSLDSGLMQIHFILTLGELLMDILYVWVD